MGGAARIAGRCTDSLTMTHRHLSGAVLEQGLTAACLPASAMRLFRLCGQIQAPGAGQDGASWAMPEGWRDWREDGCGCNDIQPAGGNNGRSRRASG